MGGGADEYEEFYDEERDLAAREERHVSLTPNPRGGTNRTVTEQTDVPELAVDVYQTADEIVVKALVAGVLGPNLNIDLTREMLTISGSRQDEREVQEDGYYQRELYWGAFSRTVLLPEEIDVDTSEAIESHGVLTIRMPKINKKRQTKLKVRSR